MQFGASLRSSMDDDEREADQYGGLPKANKDHGTVEVSLVPFEGTTGNRHESFA